jgi:hypothetical protein
MQILPNLFFNFLVVVGSEFEKSLAGCKEFNVDMINNIARYNLIDTKYRQMAFRSARWCCSRALFGQTKVSGDRQRETTHEICCLAAELSNG